MKQDCNKNTSEFCNATNNILICFTVDARDIIPGHDCNRNQCVFLSVIQGQVTFSHTGSHLLQASMFQGSSLSMESMRANWENRIKIISGKSKSSKSKSV